MTGYIIKRKLTHALLQMSEELTGLYEVCKHGVYTYYVRLEVLEYIAKISG
jgi:hypothetical protein